jgi:hypothetical protein
MRVHPARLDDVQDSAAIMFGGVQRGHLAYSPRNLRVDI